MNKDNNDALMERYFKYSDIRAQIDRFILATAIGEEKANLILDIKDFKLEGINEEDTIKSLKFLLDLAYISKEDIKRGIEKYYTTYDAVDIQDNKVIVKMNEEFFAQLMDY